jgi:hypothetical protein
VLLALVTRFVYATMLLVVQVYERILEALGQVGDIDTYGVKARG